MPSTYKSPYASSFKSAIKRGTPAKKAVDSIARNRNTTPTAIVNSLHKAGLCQRQKFNGQWVYWPGEDIKKSATSAKSCQVEMWQSFIDWCILSGHCKPLQLENNRGSQQEFMSYCRKFFNRQLSAGSPKSTSRKRSSVGRSRKRTTTTAKRRSSVKSYKFPRSSSARRYRRAA